MSRNYLHIKYLHGKMSEMWINFFLKFQKHSKNAFFNKKNGKKLLKKWNFSTEQSEHIFDKCSDKNSSYITHSCVSQAIPQEFSICCHTWCILLADKSGISRLNADVNLQIFGFSFKDVRWGSLLQI